MLRSTIAAACFAILSTQAAAQCELAKIQPDAGFFLDGFGGAVDARGDLLLCGAPQADLAGMDQGAAYVFERIGADWVQRDTLLASDGELLDRFGNDVAIEGDWALVGTPRKSGSTGAVYAFERVGNDWIERQKITASDGAPVDNFGGHMALRGGVALISSQRAAHANGPDAGAVYVFELVGTTWMETAKLIASDVQMDGNFGSAIGFDPDGAHVAIGALWTTGVAPRTGAVYLFEEQGGQWIETDQLIASDGAGGDLFGAGVSLDGDALLVSAPVGEAVYFFEQGGGGWNEVAKRAPGTPGTTLSGGVLLRGELAFVGDRSDDAVHFVGGALQVYRREASGWEALTRVVASDVGVFWGFGVSLAAADGVLYVGASAADGAVDGSGAVYAESLDLARIETYCSATPNSTGGAARIDYEGTTSVTLADLTLRAAPVPDQPGLFYFGPARIELPFGNGFRCVGGGVSRFAPASASNQELVHVIDFGTPPGSALDAGALWHFQAWFRDPAAGGAGFDLSDGLTLPLCP